MNVATLQTDFITVLGAITAMNPIIMGTHNEPVCYYCGFTQHRNMPDGYVQHAEMCLWVRANALMEATRSDVPNSSPAPRSGVFALSHDRFPAKRHRGA